MFFFCACFYPNISSNSVLSESLSFIRKAERGALTFIKISPNIKYPASVCSISSKTDRVPSLHLTSRLQFKPIGKIEPLQLEMNATNHVIIYFSSCSFQSPTLYPNVSFKRQSTRALQIAIR